MDTRLEKGKLLPVLPHGQLHLPQPGGRHAPRQGDEVDFAGQQPLWALWHPECECLPVDVAAEGQRVPLGVHEYGDTQREDCGEQPLGSERVAGRAWAEETLPEEVDIRAAPHRARQRGAVQVDRGTVGAADCVDDGHAEPVDGLGVAGRARPRLQVAREAVRVAEESEQLPLRPHHRLEGLAITSRAIASRAIASRAAAPEPFIGRRKVGQVDARTAAASLGVRRAVLGGGEHGVGGDIEPNLLHELAGLLGVVTAAQAVLVIVDEEVVGPRGAAPRRLLEEPAVDARHGRAQLVQRTRDVQVVVDATHLAEGRAGGVRPDWEQEDIGPARAARRPRGGRKHPM